MTSRRDELFENLTRLAGALAAQFDPTCEIVVHDLSRPGKSIVFIGGNVTGRNVGGPLTDFALARLREDASPEDVVGYLAHTRDGKTLKSSTVFIKDHRGKPIGVFCVNFDISALLETERQLSLLTSPKNLIEVDKNFPSDVPNLLEEMIQKTFDRLSNGSNGHAGSRDKEHRQALVRELDKQGAFRIRNAIPIVADLFQVSRYTVYKDLKEIRTSSGNQVQAESRHFG